MYYDMSGFDYGILDVVQVLHLRKRRGNYYDCPFCGETHPFIRMIKKKCKAVVAEKLNLMLWKIYMVSSRKEEFVTAAKKELQPYLTKKDEKQIDTTYDTTYTIDRRH